MLVGCVAILLDSGMKFGQKTHRPWR
jgi:hypothetical protein